LTALGAIWRGWQAAIALLSDRQFDAIQARSHIPLLLALLLRCRHRKLHLIADLDGDMPQERVDEGAWSTRSPSFWLLKGVEAIGVRSGTAVICRTQQAAARLRQRQNLQNPDKLYVIPNGSDPEVFRPFTEVDRLTRRKAFGISENGLVVLYSGSIGTLYEPEVIRNVFIRLTDLCSNSWLIVATTALDLGAELRNGLPSDVTRHVVVSNFSPHEMPPVVACADVGLAFRAQQPSQLAVSPVKVCEYLCSGVPVLTNFGVGDLPEVLKFHELAGLAINDFSNSEFDRAAAWIVQLSDKNRAAARALGLQLFSSARAAIGYDSVYDHLEASSRGESTFGGTRARAAR
jgi:glycosyltransferase involved in cell wall biosynthesis